MSKACPRCDLVLHGEATRLICGRCGYDSGGNASLPCVWRGDRVGYVECRCRGKPPVHHCNKYFGPCVRPTSKPIVESMVKLNDGITYSDEVPRTCWDQCEGYETRDAYNERAAREGLEQIK